MFPYLFSVGSEANVKQCVLFVLGRPAVYLLFISIIRNETCTFRISYNITTSFAGEGSIVFSMDELYYGKISEEYVETLEEVETYRISLATLTHLFETNIELCNWGRIIHQNEYRRLHRSHKDHLTLSARERYEAFKEQFPDAYRRVNLGYIASYLGIRLSTLSRLRANG